MDDCKIPNKNRTLTIGLRQLGALLILSLLIVGSSSWKDGQAQSISIQWFQFDPMAIRADRTDPVQFSLKIEGSPSSVQLQLAAGGRVNLTVGSGGVWSVTLTAAQALFDYQPDDANHNFVGFLDIFQGSTRALRLNTFIDVLDKSVSTIELVNRGNQIRSGKHVVNFWRPDFSPDQLPSITKFFYAFFGDDYDFINLVFALPSFQANRYHFPVKNEVRGIGLRIFNDTVSYGSAGKLQGITVFPIDSFFDLAETGAIHEIGHQWINYLELPLLKAGSPHWPISSLAHGIMGFNISGSGVGGDFPFELVLLPNGQYQFQSAALPREFTDLDLYLMGLLPASQVGTHLVVKNQNQQICHDCFVQGAVEKVSINDVITVQGARFPDASSAQKQFHVATIVITRNRLLNDEEMGLFDYFAARGEATEPLLFSSGLAKGKTKPFLLATRGLGMLITPISPK